MAISVTSLLLAGFVINKIFRRHEAKQEAEDLVEALTRPLESPDYPSRELIQSALREHVAILEEQKEIVNQGVALRNRARDILMFDMAWLGREAPTRHLLPADDVLKSKPLPDLGSDLAEIG